MNAVATGVSGPGPMPGVDPRESARVVLGECHRLPFLPELADRGLGADQVGRTLAMLADLPVDVSPRGWRLAGSPGRAARTASDLLDRDLDALEEADESVRAPEGDPAPVDRRLVARVLGPWSLAAQLELPGGLPVLTDRGARRDLAEALAEGVADRITRLAGRMGAGARIVLDEPMLWHVAAGTVAGPSRFDPIPAVPEDRLALSLCRFADVLRRGGVTDVLIRVPAGTGPEAPARWSAVSQAPRGETPLDGLCVPAELLHSSRSHSALDAAGTVLGAGRILQMEGLPGIARPPRTGADVERSVSMILALLDRLSAPRHAALDQLVFTPTVEDMVSGRVGPVEALAAVRRVTEAAPRLAE
ncbi:cobalamin-independent methionine synthase [Dietzia sp. PP-33]|uniref:cobalamin-independent methionine synthase n=1 Tax=Dietzia sp. PP-33 TaxID=2957500 RepID=UPI0029A190AB|nr:cobalamin-independent methionine synthase [Dietzia sp. PP-33]MDX2355703.1 cobalamin-independent methionine synthase [Dietzia sp. PP-33]